MSFGMIDGLERRNRGHIVGAAFDPDRALRGRRQHFGKVDRRTDVVSIQPIGEQPEAATRVAAGPPAPRTAWTFTASVAGPLRPIPAVSRWAGHR